MYSIKENLRLKKQRAKTLTSPSNYGRHSVQCNWLQSRIESAKSSKIKVSRLESIAPRQKRNSKMYTSFRTSSNFKKQVTLIKYKPLDVKPLTYFMVGRCNNEQLISKILNERDRWVKHQSKSISEINLVWGYTSGMLMSKLKDTVVLSRIPGSNQMTDKGNLYQKVSIYCEKHGLNLNFLPITFFLDREGPPHLLKTNVKEFVQFFNHVKQHTNLSNTWIMKPTNMNQGRDISLFDSLTMLTAILGQHKTEALQKREKYFKKPPQSIEQIIEAYVNTNRSLVLQKYIENPLLINRHKFDIRMWILVDHLHNFYIFQEGYLRFSTQPYQLNKASISDNFMHLTNHSLQKYSPFYSQNQCLQPISVLKDELQQRGKGKYFKIIQEKMKDIVEITVRACLSDLKCIKYRCFELYGFDFLIDRELNVRLIEANCNPAITLDNNLLAQLIPKMINDAFKLTIDKIYGTKSGRLYHVSRLNCENGWVRLGNLKNS